MRPLAGAIVIVDWRDGALPLEPTKQRPAVVVEDTARFPESYPNLLVVPFTTQARLGIPSFSERIEPSTENGLTSVSWALAHHVTSVSISRVSATPSFLRGDQLASIRERVVLALGIEES